MNRHVSLSILLAVTLLGCASTSSISADTEKIAKASEQKPELTSKIDQKNSSVLSANSGQTLPITAKTKIATETIELEVAQTPKQQALGLMFRESLSANRGMLFPFSEPQIARFWMKNVSISLDMIFLHDGQIKAIAANVPPCHADPCPVYGPDILINQVLELRGGRAKELDLKIGARLDIEFLDISQQN